MSISSLKGLLTAVESTRQRTPPNIICCQYHLHAFILTILDYCDKCWSSVGSTPAVKVGRLQKRVAKVIIREGSNNDPEQCQRLSGLTYLVGGNYICALLFTSLWKDLYPQNHSFQWSVLLSTKALDQSAGEKSLSHSKKLIVTYYFITLAKGRCNKTVISLGSVACSAPSAVCSSAD